MDLDFLSISFSDLEINFTPILILLLILGFVALVVNYYYLFGVYSKLAFYKKKIKDLAPLHPVTIIICARNEYNNLKNNLPLILDQDYPEFEVIVVNDCSHDDSKYLLSSMSAENSKLRVTTIEENLNYKHGKKFALTIGMKSAKYDYILLTDADCVPNSRHWISKMMQNYTKDETEIVLGYSPYKTYPGFLNKFIRFETFMTALNYLTFAIKGNPYMGVGRNLSYKKDLFIRNKGFASHLHLPSGDDDLFVNANATSINTEVEFSIDSITLSEPKLTYGDYWKQKTRHQSVGKYYKSEHKVALSLKSISFIMLVAVMLAIPFLGATYSLFSLVFLLLYAIPQMIIFRLSMKRLYINDLWFFSFFYELCYHLFLLLLNIFKPIATKVKWK